MKVPFLKFKRTLFKLVYSNLQAISLSLITTLETH